MKNSINISNRGGQYFKAALLLVFVLGGILACDTATQKKPVQKEEKQVNIPDFNADSAYSYVAKQVAFGPRVPNMGSHINCGQWLGDFLEEQGGKLYRQTAIVTAFNGDQLAAQNIIAHFNPDAPRRIMLSAHWDSRPFSDEDKIIKDKPIPGANDAGSGVGILLEIARQMKANPPSVGVDIFLWDAEDYGNPGTPNSYCLGTQYWAKNPHIPNYRAMYGVNLDMVGAVDAQFSKEAHSMQYAPHIVEKVWLSARRQGYSDMFTHVRSNPVTDDHLYVNTLAKIPCIDVIHQRDGGGFFEHWHTLQDDMDVISKNTLKAVGQTMMDVIYRE